MGTIGGDVWRGTREKMQTPEPSVGPGVHNIFPQQK